uniref:Type I restriction modification DNA specificity domain-containing protein n=1 Tax=Candidatus Methanogaster sp. ANME-2c ERB4 TaxID=2759911 RepID=A0A7G9YMQ2_9EURY|nr:hypothetical protein ANJBEOKM_00026 [Methanosarcinales archaeon ANME-2c ERB4]
MSEWKEFKLGEIYDFASGLSKSRDQFGFGYSFLSFRDVFHNYFVPKKITQLANSTEKERERCSIKRGDVFLTTDIPHVFLQKDLFLQMVDSG